jgi:divalent metal cation (Fe/Co/Zn/Cd) transporter
MFESIPIHVKWLIVSWLLLGLLGIPSLMDWYQIKHYDKLVHLLAGVAITSYLIYLGWKVQPIIVFNIVVAIVWEFVQILTKDTFGLVDVGFPDGYYDIIIHIIGTIGYLLFMGVL